MESLERPCSLCPVDAVDMFTGSMVICRLIVVSNDDTRDGRMLTVTSFRSVCSSFSDVADNSRIFISSVSTSSVLSINSTVIH
eukprot:scaffold89817_cov45-Cyclotella_meneghiniana.AAC.1